MSLSRAFRQLRHEATTLDRECIAEDAVWWWANGLAAGGLALHQATGSPIPDAVAALNLARRNREFLIGREVTPTTLARVADAIEQPAGVARVGELPA